MEERTDLLSEDLLHTDVRISERSAQAIQEISRWSKFIGITGMILTSIVVVMVFAIGGKIEEALNNDYISSGSDGFLVLLPVLLAAAAFFAISYFLYRFALQVKQAIQSFDTFELARAVKNLKNTYILSGIMLGLYLLYSIYSTIVTVL
ncbi:MAG: hypothetical protein QM687_14810 [Ferruginibacter sp.]